MGMQQQQTATLPKSESFRPRTVEELTDGRAISTMTRAEALQSLDRASALCVRLMEANEAQRIRIAELENQQRENAAGAPQSSNGKPERTGTREKEIA